MYSGICSIILYAKSIKVFHKSTQGVAHFSAWKRINEKRQHFLSSLELAPGLDMNIYLGEVLLSNPDSPLLAEVPGATRAGYEYLPGRSTPQQS
jgi:hypothetical protein